MNTNSSLHLFRILVVEIEQACRDSASTMLAVAALVLAWAA